MQCLSFVHSVSEVLCVSRRSKAYRDRGRRYRHEAGATLPAPASGVERDLVNGTHDDMVASDVVCVCVLHCDRVSEVNCLVRLTDSVLFKTKNVQSFRRSLSPSNDHSDICQHKTPVLILRSKDVHFRYLRCHTRLVTSNIHKHLQESSFGLAVLINHRSNVRHTSDFESPKIACAAERGGSIPRSSFAHPALQRAVVCALRPALPHAAGGASCVTHGGISTAAPVQRLRVDPATQTQSPIALLCVKTKICLRSENFWRVNAGIVLSPHGT